jgi:hypothetical protein
VKAYDARLLRFGFRIDTTDCFAVPWQPDDQDALSRAANWLAGGRKSIEPLSLASCGLARVQRDPADVERERRASALFDRIEKSCPGLFRGQTAVTEPFGAGWSRNYNGWGPAGGISGDQLSRSIDATALQGRCGPRANFPDWQRGDRARVPCVVRMSRLLIHAHESRWPARDMDTGGRTCCRNLQLSGRLRGEGRAAGGLFVF